VTCVNVGPFKNGRYALITIGGRDGRHTAEDRAEIAWRTI
jgi:hypothetical protein